MVGSYAFFYLKGAKGAMLKKLIEYTDYNGKKRKENFYFYLNKAELMEMELGTIGGMQNLIQLIIDKQDIPEIIKAFKSIILKAYGEKSADGVRFVKSPELSEAFMQTEAYSNLFMELISNADAAATFINAIVPEDLQRTTEDEKEEVSDVKDAGTGATTDAEGNIHLLGQK